MTFESEQFNSTLSQLNLVPSATLIMISVLPTQSNNTTTTTTTTATTTTTTNKQTQPTNQTNNNNNSNSNNSNNQGSGSAFGWIGDYVSKWWS